MNEIGRRGLSLLTCGLAIAAFVQKGGAFQEAAA
jgi:hypothetical protein